MLPMRPNRFARPVMKDETRGILINALLFLIKFLSGTFLALPSLAAHGWLNFGYILMILLVIFPYGRFEKRKNLRPLLHFLAAFILFEAGFSLFTDAFTALLHPAEGKTGVIPFLVLLAVTVIQEFLLTDLAQRAAKKTSRALAVPASRRLADGLLLLPVLLSFLLSWAFGIRADAFACFLISVFVMKDAALIAIRMMREMIAEEPDPEVIANLRRTIRSCSGIFGTGQMRLHFYGAGRRLVVMHVYVPAEEDEKDAKGRLSTIAEMAGRSCGLAVWLRPEAFDGTDENACRALRDLTDVLEAEDWKVSADSFHYVRGQSFDNLIYDLCVPEGYTAEAVRDLCGRAETALRNRNPRYTAVPSVKILR